MTDTVISQGWVRPHLRAKSFSVTEPSEWDGPRIQALRRRFGWSQQQLSEVLAVNRVSVTQWETSHTEGPQKQSICRLLDLLEADPDHLMDRIRG
jgi:transcriptional regulator with XRE-family HTH domain